MTPTSTVNSIPVTGLRTISPVQYKFPEKRDINTIIGSVQKPREKVFNPEEIDKMIEEMVAEKLQIAKQNYKKDLASKKLQYVPEKINFLGKKTKEAHYIYNVDKDGEKYGDIKSRYNLPDGIFKNYVQGFGGDRNMIKVFHSIDIPAEDLEKAISLKK